MLGVCGTRHRHAVRLTYRAILLQMHALPLFEPLVVRLALADHLSNVILLVRWHDVGHEVGPLQSAFPLHTRPSYT